MMKKLLFFALVLALVLGLCACGSDAKFSEADLSLTVDGVSVTAKSEVADLLDSFGEGYEYSEAISCVYEGMDKTFTYENFSLYTYPNGSSDCLMEIYCVDGDVKTAKGITFGSTKSEIEAAYGKGTEAGSTLTYELPAKSEENVPASLYFVLRDDAVTAIAMTTEHRAE